MLALGYNFWTEWEAQEKVDFDGANKHIIVYPGVTSLDIREDVWSAYVRWNDMQDRGNDRWGLAMERSGLDPIPGGETGDLYFLVNGWKLLVDLSSVAVTGVLYSRDFDSAFYTPDGVLQFPATVSALVNTVTVTSNVVTGDLATVPAAVWAEPGRGLTDPVTIEAGQADQLTAIYRANFNRRKHDSVLNTITIFDTDGVTPLYVFDVDDALTDITPQ